MKTKTTAYSQLADLCEAKGDRLELTHSKRGMSLRISRKDSPTISTSFRAGSQDEAAKRLLEKL